MAFENAAGIRGLAIFFLIDFVVPFRRSDSRFSLNTTLAQLLVASIFFFSLHVRFLLFIDFPILRLLFRHAAYTAGSELKDYHQNGQVQVTC